jgi:hypothetical protein
MHVDIMDDGDHQYEFRATGTAIPSSGSCENLGGGARVIGHWNVVPVSPSHPAIEIS